MENELKSAFDLYVIEKIKTLRKEKNISQLALAQGIGVSAGFIGRIESPNHNAKYNLDHINKVSKFLHVSPRSLLPEESI